MSTFYKYIKASFYHKVAQGDQQITYHPRPALNFDNYMICLAIINIYLYILKVQGIKVYIIY